LRKLAIIDKNSNARFSQWRAAPEPKKFFYNDRSLIDNLKNYKPDVIFINKGSTFSNVKYAMLKYKSIYFYGDYYRPVPDYVRQYARMANAVIFTNKDKWLWNCIGNKNTFFISQGVDTDIFKPVNVEKKYDIVFGGNYYGSKFCGSDIRMQLVRHIKDMSLDFCVVGDGWPDDIQAIPRQGVVEYNKIINSARVTVGISHFIDVPCYTSNRLYQMMATGVPHIAWYSPGVKELFKTGYCEVSQMHQLDNLINIYVTNKKERDTKGWLQRQEILNSHTIFDSWNKIEKIMGSL
jgi:spore maturation protein CgeB